MPSSTPVSVDIHAVQATYLQADDLNVAASIAYNAYHNDALFEHIFQAEREGYESRLRQAIKQELTACWDAEQILLGLFEGTRLLAVTCITKPNQGFVPGRMWHWRLKMMLTAGLFSTRQFVEKEERIRALIPAESFHMISLIGVHPDYQHIGLGHVLMGAIDTIVAQSEESQGVGVFATVPAYRYFFEDGGYSKVTSLQIAGVEGDVLYKKRSSDIPLR
ncbi:GNAT family N-acetyltransferase [Salinimonas sediminis]|uniref:GNAT family N-acetyltransferase n=1 Tax=Salinimonas sediminis TaxID=2303538 RepID=A0A346NJF3_9ALTE|nr:GNAT family N-acetyltransferase [Salinimonas sediminis]AXR05660.1 GNAT family N-acetyltransferase [Salinimonas sediminis]